MTGREAYEADVKARPYYATGEPRKTWEQLGDIARWSWERELCPVYDPKCTRADPVAS